MSQLEKSDQKVFSADNGMELQPMKEVTEDNVIDTNEQVPGPIPFAAWLIIVSKLSLLFIIRSHLHCMNASHHSTSST